LQVESGVDKAREKIDSIGEKTKERFQNWKQVLSGALNDPQLILGLSVLFAFYVFLTSFNSIVGGNSKEENSYTCECPILHRIFYRSVIVIGLSTWFFGFLLITIWDAFKFWRYRYKSRHPEKFQPSSETRERTISFFERTIDSVEAGAQAMMKVPVKSMLTKTLDIVDDGVETLREANDGIKQLKDNPIEAILAKTMRSVNDQMIQDSNTTTDDDKNDAADDKTMLQNATELVDMARQDPLLGKLIKPLEEKVKVAKQTTAGSMLTDIVTNGAKIVQENPAGAMLTKAMELVDNKTQPNQASSMLTKPVEFITAEKENSSEILLAASVGALVADEVLSSKLQTSDKAKQTTTGSALTTAMDLVDAAREDPIELLSGKGMELAIPAVEPNPPTSSMLAAAVQENSTEASVDAMNTVASNQGLFRSTLQTSAVPIANSVNDGVQTLEQADTKTSAELLNTTVASQLTDDATNVNTKGKVHPAKQSQAKPLSPADQKTLQRIKHYENFLWMEFYKVYSVGATTDDESHALPSFVKILGDAVNDGTSMESDTQPLLQALSYDGTPVLPSIVVEPDLSDEDSDVEDFDEIEYTRDLSAASNSANTSTERKNNVNARHEVAATSTTENGIQKSAHDDMPEQKSSIMNSKSSLFDDATKDSNSTSSITDNDSDSNESNSFLRSWVDLRPEGLYTDIDEEDNIVIKAADVTCASVGFFLYPFLVVVRLLAQLALVPLLSFQVLEGYSWICVTDDVYCKSTLNQYRLGLDKAALGFTFYCCLLIAILSSTIIRWFPCSKNARAAGANCIM